MIEALFIKRLREGCPSFDRRVYGAADLWYRREQSLSSLPAAFVMPASDLADTSNERKTIVSSTVQIVVAVPSGMNDHLKQDAFMYVRSLRNELLCAINKWVPSQCFGRVQYQGGALTPTTHKGVVEYAYNFRVDETISDKISTEAQLDWDGQCAEEMQLSNIPMIVGS